MDGANCSYHIIAGALLKDITTRAGLNGPKDVLRCRIHGQNYNFCGRACFTYLLGRLDPVKLRHGNVHENHFGFQMLHLPHSICSRAGLTRYSDVGLRLKEQPKTFPHHLVIICQENRDAHINSYTMSGLF
jgi:hypothetical protein